jgi:hypothetical protein
MRLAVESLTHRRTLYVGEGGSFNMGLCEGRPVTYFSDGGIFDEDERGGNDDNGEAFDSLAERERSVLSQPHRIRSIARDRPRNLWRGPFVEELLRSSMERISELVNSLMRLPQPGKGNRKVEAQFQREAVVPALREGIEAMTLTVERDKIPLEFPSRTIPIEGFQQDGRMAGAVDVLLPRPADHPRWGKAPSGIELKWCWEATTFGNCLWDALKLASAQAEGQLDRAYLLVGGATCGFLADAPGNEPFRGSEGSSWEVTAPELLSISEYEPWWAKWRAEVKPRPRLVPESLRTTLVKRQTTHDLTVALAEVRVSDPRRRIIDRDGKIRQLLA